MSYYTALLVLLLINIFYKVKSWRNFLHLQTGWAGLSCSTGVMTLTLLPPSGETKDILGTLLLRVLQVFVGLSFPYEGPAPLEALANGCIFLNPRLNPPKSRLNSEFFRNKPNIREVRNGISYNLELFWLTWTSMHSSIVVGSGTMFTAGDITAPLCRGHRRAVCVDGRYGQFYRCRESCQRYHQPDSKYVYIIIHIICYVISECVYSCVSVSISGRTVSSLWIHLWRDAPESQYPDWKTGWINLYWQERLRKLGSVNSSVLFTSFVCLSGLLFQHNKLAPTECAPGPQSNGQLFL